MIKNVILFIFAFGFTFGFSQNNPRAKTDEAINLEIAHKIPKLKLDTESNVMNPFTKGLYSTFAIEKFKIEYYLKEKDDAPMTTQQRIQLIKDATVKYETLMNKYYDLAKTRATERQKQALIASQDAWEVFKKKEFARFLTLLKDDLLDCNYYSDYCKLIKNRMSTMFDSYSDFIEHGN